MSADICEEGGLILPPLSTEIREMLRMKGPEIWDWLGNPVDYSVVHGSSISTSEILEIMIRSNDFNLIIANITEDAPLAKKDLNFYINKETEDIITMYREKEKPLVVVASGGKITSGQFQDWRWKLLAEQRERLVAARVPTYSTMTEAVRAIRKFIDYCQAKAML